jgi:hypothetical protein
MTVAGDLLAGRAHILFFLLGESFGFEEVDKLLNVSQKLRYAAS